MKAMIMKPLEVRWSIPYRPVYASVRTPSRSGISPLFEEGGIRFFFESATYGAGDEKKFEEQMVPILKAIFDEVGDAAVVVRRITDIAENLRCQDYDVYDSAMSFFSDMTSCGWLLTFVAEYDGDLYIDCSYGMRGEVEMSCCLRSLPGAWKHGFACAHGEGQERLFDRLARKISISGGEAPCLSSMKR